ncbi:MAG: hypothetical protein ABIA78_00135 [archaeon]
MTQKIIDIKIKDVLGWGDVYGELLVADAREGDVLRVNGNLRGIVLEEEGLTKPVFNFPISNKGMSLRHFYRDGWQDTFIKSPTHKTLRVNELKRYINGLQKIPDFGDEIMYFKNQLGSNLERR